MKKKTFMTAAAALLASLTLNTATVFAADANATSTTKDTSSVVKIQKTLNIADGITTPNTTFTFTFTQKDSTTTKTTVAAQNVPIGNKTVTYANSDKHAQGTGEEKILKVTENIFAGITYNDSGEYVYLVDEEETGFTSTAATADSVTYDKSQYEMHVIVKEKSDASGFYIANVYFKQTMGETGAAVTGTAKKDSETNENGEATYNLFTNTYVKDAGKEDEDPNNPDGPGKDPNADDKSLTITKALEGTFAKASQDFTFKVTLFRPSTSTQETFTAKYNKKDGTSSDVTFTNGVEQTFTLKGDETLTFDKLPAGTYYQISEDGAQNYQAKSDYVSNGKTQAIAFGNKVAGLAKTEKILVGEKTNTNTVTNKFADDDVTPTGLLINNLPFILMIAGAGAVMFAVTASKKRHA